MTQLRHLLKSLTARFPKSYSGGDSLPICNVWAACSFHIPCPLVFRCGGATLTPLCSLFIFGKPEMGFGDAFLTALMSATMAAAVFYYAGSQLLKDFGLPSDTTMIEFHKFMTGR